MDRETFIASLEGLPEEKKTELIAVFDENEKLKSIKNQAFQDRDKEKQRAKELQDRLEAIQKEKEEELKKQQEEQGKFKDLYEQTATKLSEKDNLVKELTEKLTPLEQAVKEAEAKAKEVESQRRKELLDQLEDEDFRKIGEKLTGIEDLREYVETTRTKFKKVGVDGSRTGKFRLPSIEGKKFDELTMEEKQELKKTNLNLYNKLLGDKINRRKT